MFLNNINTFLKQFLIIISTIIIITIILSSNFEFLHHLYHLNNLNKYTHTSNNYNNNKNNSNSNVHKINHFGKYIFEDLNNIQECKFDDYVLNNQKGIINILIQTDILDSKVLKDFCYYKSLKLKLILRFNSNKAPPFSVLS
jgi:uncharacterized protein YxeA